MTMRLQRLTTLQAILLGGLTVGVLDITDAFVFFGLRNNVGPLRILQGIASGLLGRDSFAGGWDSGVIGILVHLSIATTIVTVYVLASRKLTFLTRWTVPCGLAYGVAAWCAMNFVVLPLTLVSRGPFVWPVVVNGLLIHMFGVGLPSAIAARAQAPSPPTA